MMAAIEVRSVTRTFDVAVRKGIFRRERRIVHAVNDLSFDVEAGSIVGYVGPNGAGKSTTIKMLTGILMPTAGSLRVAGLDPLRQRLVLARHIGVLFGQRVQLWWDLPLRDSFELLRYVYEVPRGTFDSTLRTVRTLLDLDPFLDTPVRQLSLGQRIRGELSAVMLHSPEILFLDEPTIGLDVVARARVREFLQSVNRERGVTILLSTHDLADIEFLSDRIMILDKGEIIYDGDLEALRDREAPETSVIVDFDVPQRPIDVVGVRVERVDGPRQWLSVRRDEISPGELIARLARELPLHDVSIEPPSIESVVRGIYEGRAEADGA